jgi:hypothetical protein
MKKRGGFPRHRFYASIHNGFKDGWSCNVLLLYFNLDLIRNPQIVQDLLEFRNQIA